MTTNSNHSNSSVLMLITALGAAILACSSEPRPGSKKSGEGGVDAVHTIRPSDVSRQIEVGTDGILLHVPGGAISKKLELEARPVKLDAHTREAELYLASEAIELSPDGTELKDVVYVEFPVEFPEEFADMPDGQTWALPVAAYTRSADENAWRRDDLHTTSAIEHDAFGILKLEKASTSRTASVLIALDHFSEHSYAFPHPLKAEPSTGLDALFYKHTLLDDVQILSPTWYLSHSVIDLISLENDAVRSAIYEELISELVIQSDRQRAALVSDFGDMVLAFAGIECQNSECDGQVVLESLARIMEAVRDRGAAAAGAYGFAAEFNRRLSDLSRALLDAAPDLRQLPDDGVVELISCLSDVVIQTLAAVVVDQSIIEARWGAIKPLLDSSELAQSDPAYREAIARANATILDFTGQDVGAQLVDTLRTYVDAWQNSDSCRELVVSTLVDVASRGLVTAIGAYLGFQGISTFSAAATTAAPLILAIYLVGDYVKNDIVKATRNTERLSLLATMIHSGGIALDASSTRVVNWRLSEGLFQMDIPDAISLYDEDAAALLQAQVLTYASDAIVTRIASVVRLDDAGITSRILYSWRDLFTGLDREAIAASFDRMHERYKGILDAIDVTFAACGVRGCDAVCMDADADGYGTGSACLGPDCDDNEAQRQVDCTSEQPAEVDEENPVPPTSPTTTVPDATNETEPEPIAMSPCANGVCVNADGENCTTCASDCCPAAPRHLQPPDGATFQQEASVSLSWGSARGASRYRVKVCTDSALQNCLTCPGSAVGTCEFDVGELQVDISELLALAPGTYYWQPQAITAYDDEHRTGWGPGAGIREFSILSPAANGGECVEECVVPEKDCNTPDAPRSRRSCGYTFDEDDCAEWGPPELCPQGFECRDGGCLQVAPTCTNACPTEAIACQSSSVRRDCIVGTSGCLEFASTQSCLSGYSCVAGQGCALNPEPGASSCPPELPSDAACDVLVNFDGASGWYNTTGAVLSSSPRTTALTIVGSVFGAQARLNGGHLEVQKSLLSSPPLGNSGVMLTWGATGTAAKYARVQCPIGEVIECVGTGPVACTGAWQILQSASSDNNWSCGLGKATGTTLVDWVATVSDPGGNGSGGTGGGPACVDTCIESMVQCPQSDQVEFCAAAGSGCLEWVAEQQPCPSGYVCRPGPWGPATACVQCGGASQPCCADGTCPGGGTCQVNGICTGGNCGSDQVVCDGECTPLQGDTLNCGTCGNVCPERTNASRACADGQCQFYCATPYDDCDGDPENGCEASLFSIATCGSCSNECPPRANAVPVCDAGVCELACEQGFDDCDGNILNGCETPINSSPEDCGACDAACSLANAMPGCSGGSCTVAGCTGNYDDCDGLPGNGCEANLGTDLAHCGGCGSSCAIDEECVDGECTGMSACNPPGMVCGAACVNTDTDAANCGSCDDTCPPSDTCAGGVCTSERIVEIDGGMNFSCARRANGTIACWGINAAGQLGDNGVEDGLGIAEVLGIADATQLSVGSYFSCVVRSGGILACWGENSYGRLGDGTTTLRRSPVAISGISNVAEVATGDLHTCARTSAGQLYCWGDNSLGQLGSGITGGEIHTPQAVSGVANVVSVAAAYGLTCIVHSTGQVSCWGYNTQGQVGSGIATAQPIPSPSVVSGLSGIVEVAADAGGLHVCARNGSGTVSCWGEGYGPAPTVVNLAAGPAQSLALGSAHSCALVANGAAYCWGANWAGQLGDGTNITRAMPVQVQTAEPLFAIGAGEQHSCAATAVGSVLCWGNGQNGRLGNGDTADHWLPVSVAGL